MDNQTGDARFGAQPGSIPSGRIGSQGVPQQIPTGSYGDQPAPRYAAQQTMAQQAVPQQPTPQHVVQQPSPQYAVPSYAQMYHAASVAQASGDAKKAAGKGKTFFSGFLGAALACVLALGGFALWQHFSGTPAESGGSPISLSFGDEDPTLAEAVAVKALPSVVSVDVYMKESTLYEMYGPSEDYGWGWGGGGGDALMEASLGSGVVLSEDGYIITNYHVIEGADAIRVTVEGEEYKADLVGGDASSDIAVLKAQGASGLTPMELGDSDQLIIGEWVMTIGSPFGLEQSVATGIVSATSRSQILEGYEDDYGNASTDPIIYPNLIQTDAAINPGNSGGALVDAEGKLIGINTLITSYSGNYSGVGFAIPVNYANHLAQQIIAGETLGHAQLGVSLYSITPQDQERYSLPTDHGAYVSGIVEGSGAEEAGLQVGDIIVAFDGVKMESASELTLAVREKNPGDTATLTVNRNGEEMELEVVLGSDAATSEAMQERSGE